jgi:hypothetical protein
MKNRIGIIAISMLMAIGISQCKKDKITPDYTYASPESQMWGKWKVAFFELNGVEHTTVFGPYAFNFSRDHTVTVTGGEKQIMGKWSIDGSKFSLDLGKEDPFGVISETGWVINKQTPTSLELKGKTGSDGTASLNFGK